LAVTKVLAPLALTGFLPLVPQEHAGGVRKDETAEGDAGGAAELEREVAALESQIPR
jgi:hypothetical protein